jgi:hypothetical protein
MAIDLNVWHYQLHQTTGSMALRFNKAGAGDLWRWAEELHRIAGEMEAEADQHDAAPSARRQPVGAQP